MRASSRHHPLDPAETASSLRRWVTDELAEREGAADERFRVLMTGLPRMTAPRGFEARVVANIGVEPAGSSLPRGVVVAARLAFVGLAVALTGYGAVALTPWVASQFVLLLNFMARGFVSVVQAADSGLDVWTIVARAGRTIGSAITAPSVTLGFVGIELIGVAALYGLHRLLRFEGERSKW